MVVYHPATPEAADRIRALLASAPVGGVDESR